jgi:hypothetical protein
LQLTVKVVLRQPEQLYFLNFQGNHMFRYVVNCAVMLGPPGEVLNGTAFSKKEGGIDSLCQEADKMPKWKGRHSCAHACLALLKLSRQIEYVEPMPGD